MAVSAAHVATTKGGHAAALLFCTDVWTRGTFIMTSIRADFSVQALGQGLLVALGGYASSVAVVIQGLTAVGASW
jgi:predicted benzoate:H+ symporter BenE